MVPDLRFEINTKDLETAIKHFPAELRFHMSDSIDHASRKFYKLLYRTRMQGPPGIKARGRAGIFIHFFRQPLGTNEKLSPSAKQSFSRTQFLNSTVDTMDLGVHMFTDSKIAGMHETGGRVTDPSGGKIAVPLSARKEIFNKSGAVRKNYRDVRAVKNLVPIKFNGKTFLAKVQKRKRTVKPLYVLKRSVRIRPRLEFFKTWDGSVNDTVNILSKGIDKTLKSTF